MNKRVLLAEDDAGIVEAMKLMLEDEGYKVETALSRADIEKFSQNLPSVLVLDIWMSGEDGREICKYLKSQEMTKHLPVILFSATKDIQRIAQEVGADDFLPKPFDIDDLLKKVERFAVR
ncbi:MAG TPA: response regulator [Ktedonobacteraceae bacterium]